MSSILEQWAEIKVLVESLDLDVVKNANGNASAGRRVRRSAMDAIKELKALRADVMAELHQRKGE